MGRWGEKREGGREEGKRKASGGAVLRTETEKLKGPQISCKPPNSWLTLRTESSSPLPSPPLPYDLTSPS
jgi:hypothetical protein